MHKLTRRKALTATLTLGTATLLSSCYTGVKVTLPEGEIIVDSLQGDIKANVESSYVLSDGTYREERLKAIANIANELLKETYSKNHSLYAESPTEGFASVYQQGDSSYSEFNPDWVLDTILTSSVTTNQGTALEYAEQGLESAVKSVLVPVIYVKEDDGTYSVYLQDSLTYATTYLKRSQEPPLFGKFWRRPSNG